MHGAAPRGSGQARPAMLGRQTPPKPDPDHSSGSIGQMLHGLRDYFAARSELLSIESREAAAFARKQLAVVLLLFLGAFFGYALLLVAIVFLLGLLLVTILPPSLDPYSWLFATGLLAALNLGLAFLAWRRLRQPPPKPLFEVSRAEFQKDREWINDQQKNESGN